MLHGAASITSEMVESAAVSSNEEYFVLKNKYVHQLLCSAVVSKIGFNGVFKLQNLHPHHWCTACEAWRVSFVIPASHYHELTLMNRQAHSDDFVFLNCTQLPYSLEISTCFPIATSIVHAVTLSLPSASERVSEWVFERVSEAGLEGASFDFAWAFPRWMYHQILLGHFLVGCATFSWLCRMLTMHIHCEYFITDSILWLKMDFVC